MPAKLRAVEPMCLSPGEAARWLGLSRSSVYRLVQAGELTARKFPGGTRTFIERTELERFQAACPVIETACGGTGQ